MKSPIEPLESRVCLSSPAGGDFAVHAATTTNLNFRHVRHDAPAVTGMQAQWQHFGQNQFADGGRRERLEARHFGPGDFDGDFRGVGFGGFGGVAVRQQRIAIGFAIKFPPATGVAQPAVEFSPPVETPAQTPAVNHTFAPPPAQAKPDSATVVVEQTKAQASKAGVVFVTPPDVAAAVVDATSPADEVLAETAEVTFNENGTTAAMSSTVVDFTAAAIGSVVEQWTANVQDVAADLMQAFAPVDLATQVVAPVARTVAGVVAPTVAAYEIVHLGSPFTLLADSLATFVEESAAVSNVVAQTTDTRGPWTLTFGVIAADLFVLSYVYRRKNTAGRVARVRLAPPDVE